MYTQVCFALFLTYQCFPLVQSYTFTPHLQLNDEYKSWIEEYKEKHGDWRVVYTEQLISLNPFFTLFH